MKYLYLLHDMIKHENPNQKQTKGQSKMQTKSQPKKILDLFTGTGSVTITAKKNGLDVKSLDINQIKGAPDVTFITDILNFRPELDLGEKWIPDIIWASPPCTEYSRAKTKGQRDIQGANKLVKKTIYIILWALKKNPRLIWIIENPQTGYLKDQKFMQKFTFVDADYCAYGFPYRKRTRFWTNQNIELKMCSGVGRCPFMLPNTNKHFHNIADGHAQYNLNGKQIPIHDKYKIPEKIIEKLILSNNSM